MHADSRMSVKWVKTTSHYANAKRIRCCRCRRSESAKLRGEKKTGQGNEANKYKQQTPNGAICAANEKLWWAKTFCIYIICKYEFSISLYAISKDHSPCYSLVFFTIFILSFFCLFVCPLLTAWHAFIRFACVNKHSLCASYQTFSMLFGCKFIALACFHILHSLQALHVGHKAAMLSVCHLYARTRHTEPSNCQCGDKTTSFHNKVFRRMSISVCQRGWALMEVAHNSHYRSIHHWSKRERDSRSKHISH